MKPIPFNLERAKAGEEIWCDGKKAWFITYVPGAHPQNRVVALRHDKLIVVSDENGNGICGIPVLSMKPEPPKKRVFWVNVYPDCIGGMQENKSIADGNAQMNRIACVRVEFEEGEGL